MSLNIDWLDESNTRYRRIISINPNSIIYFYSGFYHDNEIHNFTHVNVGYDKTQKAIYFNFRKFDDKNKDNIPGGFLTITKDKRGTSAKIAALALFKRNNLSIKDCAGKYPYHFIKDPKYGGLFYIKFDEKNKVQQ